MEVVQKRKRVNVNVCCYCNGHRSKEKNIKSKYTVFTVNIAPKDRKKLKCVSERRKERRVKVAFFYCPAIMNSAPNPDFQSF